MGSRRRSDLEKIAIKILNRNKEPLSLLHLFEKIHQEIIAPVVWIGSEKINVAQLMLDTVALVQQLADQLASHTHPSTGQPTNSSDIAQSSQQAAALSTKYSPVIGK